MRTFMEHKKAESFAIMQQPYLGLGFKLLKTALQKYSILIGQKFQL